VALLITPPGDADVNDVISNVARRMMNGKSVTSALSTGDPSAFLFMVIWNKASPVVSTA
jgi:hypothetical protein